MATQIPWEDYTELVNVVRDHGARLLYDMNSKGWKNQKMKLAEYRRLLNEHEGLRSYFRTEENAMNVFKKIRHEFNRVTRDHGKKSGGGTDDPILWPLYEPCSFLAKHVRDRDTEGNYGRGGESTYNRQRKPKNGVQKTPAVPPSNSQTGDDRSHSSVPAIENVGAGELLPSMDSQESSPRDEITTTETTHAGASTSKSGTEANSSGSEELNDAFFSSQDSAESLTSGLSKEGPSNAGSTRKGRGQASAAGGKETAKKTQKRLASSAAVDTAAGSMSVQEKALELLSRRPTPNELWAESLAVSLDTEFTPDESASFRVAVENLRASQLLAKKRRLSSSEQHALYLQAMPMEASQHSLMGNIPPTVQLVTAEGSVSFEDQPPTYAELTNVPLADWNNL